MSLKSCHLSSLSIHHAAWVRTESLTRCRCLGCKMEAERRKKQQHTLHTRGTRPGLAYHRIWPANLSCWCLSAPTKASRSERSRHRTGGKPHTLQTLKPIRNAESAPFELIQLLVIPSIPKVPEPQALTLNPKS